MFPKSRQDFLKFFSRPILSGLIGVLVFCGLMGLGMQKTWASGVYEQQTPSWNGTGKIYMGREIAPLMGYQGAAWLERPSRNQEEASDKLIQLLPLEPTNTVADIGAGTGFMSVRLSERLPKGQVFAVDIQPEMVDILKTRLKHSSITNIRPVLGEERSLHLDDQSIDLALMVDVYHELAYPQEMLSAISSALKPHGKLVLAEYKAENSKVLIKPLHKMRRSQIKAELLASGFNYENSIRGLPQQHLLVFEKN